MQGEQQPSRTRSTVVPVDASDSNRLICHEHHSPFVPNA
jgi:hypothetical protein